MQTEQLAIKLLGRLFLEGEIEAVTGLHIGAGRGAIAVGGMDNPVVRDPMTQRPYIPGSSLKGKMRSLLEKREGRQLKQRIGEARIHICDDPTEYNSCPVCHIFGLPGDKEHAQPTRLVVRDVPLSDESAERMRDLDLDAPYTEVKWEVAIDRITAAANPRQMERVPAGAKFYPLQMVYSLYEAADAERFRTLAETMQLLEDDYLGGQGSRGSGRIRFRNLRLSLRSAERYQELHEYEKGFDDLGDLLGDIQKVLRWAKGKLGIGQG